MYEVCHINCHCKKYNYDHHSAVGDVQDCDIVISEFKVQSCYYVLFWTSTLGKKFYLLSYGLYSTTTALYMSGFNIKCLMKVGMSLIPEEIKPNRFKFSRLVLSLF